jgi:hypothetical protein
MVLSLKPTVILASELVEWSAFDHRQSPGMLMASRHHTYGQSEELEIETIETHRF